MDLKLAGRMAVVTGADSGIGFQTALTLAAEGAFVLMTDRTESKLQAALEKAQLQLPDAQFRAFAADLTSTEDTVALRQRADELGGAAVLAHLAGARGAHGDFLSLSDEGWHQTLDIDLLGAVRVCRALIPGMLERGYGRIVLTASENAVQPSTDETPYNAAKAGIVNLGKALSKAYGKRGVHVNVVSPAFIATPMTDAMMEERASEMGIDKQQAITTFLQVDRPGITAERRGTPQEVANVITFLCSDAASFVDGSNWRVDDGSVETAFG
jgi:NAD(P)-dependent dehydrogenase (short-subunit alcohol dehydrogenase family)